MTSKIARIMTVLPPKEGFSPNSVGAIGLLIQRLANSNDLIVGKAINQLPFKGLHYLEISKSWYSPLIKNRAYCFGIISLIKKYKPSLVEIHNRPEIALYIAKKFPLIPVSITLHNDPLSMRGLKTRYERQCICIIRNLHVVAVSQWIKEQFLSDQVMGEVTILSNHIDLNQIPKYVPISKREKTVLFVGRVVADKGADIFVSLCSKLIEIDPTWNIEIIGADRFDIDSPQTPFIEKLYKQVQQTQIKMIGYLPYDQVLQKISVASVVIMPSRWPEPFGMTALEAMACGTPLLVSSVGALPSLVESGGVFMDPNNIDEAFQQLLALIQDKNTQEKLSLHAKVQACKYSSINALQSLNNFRKQICPVLQGSL